MKTKEELLKIYSAYLPYELEISTDDEGEDWTEIVIGLNNEALETKVGNYWDYTVKPILYSMDMLTKEIEHKGERFVPFNFLSPFLRSKIEFSKYIPNIKYFRLKDYLLLLEWHFNVFGLDESEFIKKETLTL